MMSALLQEIQGFRKRSLVPTDTVVKSMPVPDHEVRDQSGAVLRRRLAGSELEANEGCLQASEGECHGCCYGFQHERATWAPPRLVVHSNSEARPGYNSMSASEYLDTDEVLRGKVRAMAGLVRKARCCVIYSGAGLSTDAGIGDYASQAPGSISGVTPPSRPALLAEIRSHAEGAGPGPAQPVPLRSPLCAQPTLAHRVLVAMHKAGYIHRWVNQNHDGLPQKAGLPQEAINEIHGAWHAPNNPVVPMSGSLRGDLFADLLDCEQRADLTIAVGTSLCGMNADRVVTASAERAATGEAGQLGSIVIGLQRTVLDENTTLRIFARCNDVFAMLAQELALHTMPPPLAGEFWKPPILAGRSEDDYVFNGLPYDAAGNRSSAQLPSARMTLDLRDDARLVIPDGMHAGAVGVIDGFDREGNPRCRFTLKPKVGKLRAPVMMPLGRWWIQAAVDGTVPTLPVINEPADDATCPASQRMRELMRIYASP